MIREQFLWHRPTKNAGEKPRRVSDQIPATPASALGQLPVEEPPDLTQRILDLGEVADAHDLEDEPVDVGFQFVQLQGQGTLATMGFEPSQ